jgi:hypothetical protein
MDPNTKFYMQYLVPEGFPDPKGQRDQEIGAQASKLKEVDRKPVRFPNSALYIHIKVFEYGGASLEIWKREDLVYINLYSLGEKYSDLVFGVVQDLYLKYKLGTPKKPKLPAYIHSIPVSAHLLRDNERLLAEKLTVEYFWAAYAQEWFKKRKSSI